ncbi:hypothetical protein ACJX0J_036060, partial [Zea mays]
AILVILQSHGFSSLKALSLFSSLSMGGLDPFRLLLLWAIVSNGFTHVALILSHMIKRLNLEDLCLDKIYSHRPSQVTYEVAVVFNSSNALFVWKLEEIISLKIIFIQKQWFKLAGIF